jgi:hypothetical protein
VSRLVAVAVALALAGCGGGEAVKPVLIDECSQECIKIDTCKDLQTIIDQGKTLLVPSVQECFPGIGYALEYLNPSTGQVEIAVCDAANTCTVLRVQTGPRPCSASSNRLGGIVEASCPW